MRYSKHPSERGIILTLPYYRLPVQYHTLYIEYRIPIEYRMAIDNRLSDNDHRIPFHGGSWKLIPYTLFMVE